MVSMVTEERLDCCLCVLSSLRDEFRLSPAIWTENGDPLIFFPLYLTVTKYFPGTIGVYATSYPSSTSLQLRSTLDGPSTVMAKVPAPTSDVSIVNMEA